MQRLPPSKAAWGGVKLSTNLQIGVYRTVISWRSIGTQPIWNGTPAVPYSLSCCCKQHDKLEFAQAIDC